MVVIYGFSGVGEIAANFCDDVGIDYLVVDDANDFKKASKLDSRFTTLDKALQENINIFLISLLSTDIALKIKQKLLGLGVNKNKIKHFHVDNYRQSMKYLIPQFLGGGGRIKLYNHGLMTPLS